jgi:HEAT repeat protein
LSRFSQKILIIVAAVSITCSGLWYLQRGWMSADPENIKVSPEVEQRVVSLLEKARTASFQSRLAITFEIRDIGRQAVPVLVRALKHQDPSTRAFAADMLKYSGNQSVIPHLAARLGDTSATVRRSALFSLGRLDAVETIPAIVLVLNDEDNFTRCQAAHVLGILGQDGAVVPLIAVLEKDACALARQTAAISLGDIGNEKAIRPLINSLEDENVLVRSASMVSLNRITGVELGPYKDAWTSWWNERHPSEVPK